MQLPIPEFEPVALFIEEIETTGDLRFSGTDLESGARLSILIERKPNDRAIAIDMDEPTRGLVLMLTIETLDAHS